MLSLRLTCLLVLGGALTIGAVAACTQTTAATSSPRGGDDDDGDDDDTAANQKKDAGSSGSSGTSGGGTSSGTSGTPEPVDSGPPPKSTMTFFITSTPASADGSGNLGGLAGADKKCQDLATAVNGGDHTWAAFLGTQNPPANPKDRIGKGPWKNQKGDIVAADVTALLDIQNPVSDSKFMDEKGAAIPPTGQYILTGSLNDGTPAQNNCKNWTDGTKASAGRYGLAIPSQNPVLGANWAFAKGQVVNDNGPNCTAASIKAVKSEARIACFAKD